MTDPERERARAILKSLRELPPGVLDAAAAHATGRDAEQIMAVRAALASPDPEAALVDALARTSRSGSTEVALDGVIRQAKSASKDVASLRDTVAAVTASRREMAFVGHTIRSAVPTTDRALLGILDQALGLLGEDGPFAAVKTAVAAAGDAEGVLAMIAAGHPDPDDLQRGVASLRGARATLEAARERLGKLPQLIAAARAFAADKGNADADARLALVDAVLRDRAPGSDERWAAALARALAAESLVLARAAAARVQLHAAATGRSQPILDSAAQIAALAERTGDVDTQIEALGDQALLLAQEAGQAARAKELVEQAQLAAGDDAMRVLRTSFLEAQVLELLGDLAGDPARARKLFREVMQYGQNIDGAGHLMGWAALHLGRIEAAHGAQFQAKQNLTFAQQVGEASGDDALAALAADARASLAK